jgi:hypothetical protein
MLAVLWGAATPQAPRLIPGGLPPPRPPAKISMLYHPKASYAVKDWLQPILE